MCLFIYFLLCLNKSPRRFGHLFPCSETFMSNAVLFKNISIKTTLCLIFDCKPETELCVNHVDLQILQSQLPVL